MGLPTFYSSIFFSPTSSCDSVATAIIDIRNSSSTYTNIIGCDSFTWVLNGETYYVSQVDTILSINSDGCTHIDSLDISINLSNAGTSIITSCDSYVWDGVIYTTTGTYTNTYNNTLGCDSTHSIILTVNSSTTETMIDTACDSFTWLTNGNIYDSSGTYIYITTNNLGCNHTETLVLVIGHTEDLNLTIDKNDIECFGYDNGSINLNASGGAPPYQISWINNSSTTQSIVSLPSDNLWLYNNRCKWLSIR
jgi:hypothetical protein